MTHTEEYLYIAEDNKEDMTKKVNEAAKQGFILMNTGYQTNSTYWCFWAQMTKVNRDG